MTDADDRSTLRRRSLRGLGIALVVAAVLLVTVVLPAEFGRDPTGVGRLLGLATMREPAAAPATVQLTDVIGGNENVITVDPGDGRGRDRLEEPDDPLDRGLAHSPVTLWISGKYSRYGRIRANFSQPVKRRG